jgi:hypothetical protein
MENNLKVKDVRELDSLTIIRCDKPVRFDLCEDGKFHWEGHMSYAGYTIDELIHFDER